MAMRRSERIGEIAVGAEADLVLLDLDTAAFTPLNDLPRQLVYAENGSSVRSVMVAGQWVIRDGVLLTLDEKAIRAEARALMAELAPDLAAAEKAAQALEPHYREMYLRAAARDVGMNRWGNRP